MPPRDKRKKDRLSELPDDILARILSNLETLDAVRTCVLSKRWVHLWTHITNLEFCAFNYDCCLSGDYPENISLQLFQNFVSMVLHRLATPSIQSCFLILDSGVNDVSVLETWCLALANKKVKGLTISYDPAYYDDEIISIHPNIFNCHSLIHLTLYTNCTVRVPNFVHLPNLQTLELSNFDFMSVNDSANTKENIILSFPVLKKLISYKTTCWEVESVSFEVPFLEMVEITEDEYGSNTYLVNYNIISKPSSCVNASVSITFFNDGELEEERKQLGLRACTLFRQLNINQVKHLKISSHKVFSFVKESFVDLPTFIMLRHLKLNKVSGRMLIDLLLKSPYLTSLTIKMEIEESTSSYWSEYGIVPDCISNTLKVLKVKNFGGDEDELNLAKYIMENAEHLELLSISPSHMLGSNKREMERIKEKLFTIKRGLNLSINF